MTPQTWDIIIGGLLPALFYGLSGVLAALCGLSWASGTALVANA